MAGAELTAAPRTWSELITRTLQLSLHHRLLADFERRGFIKVERRNVRVLDEKSLLLEIRV